MGHAPTLLELSTPDEQAILLAADPDVSVREIVQNAIDIAVGIAWREPDGTVSYPPDAERIVNGQSVWMDGWNVDGTSGCLIIDVDKIHIDGPLIMRTGLKLTGFEHGSGIPEIRFVNSIVNAPPAAYTYPDETGSGLRLLTNTDDQIIRKGKRFIWLQNIEINCSHVQGVTMADFRYAPHMRLTGVRFSNIGEQSVGFLGVGLLYPQFDQCEFLGKGRAVELTIAPDAWYQQWNTGVVVKLSAYYGANKGVFRNCRFTNAGGCVFGGAVTVDHCDFETGWVPSYAPPLASGDPIVALVDTRDFQNIGSDATIGHRFEMTHCYFELHIPGVDPYDPNTVPLVGVHARGGALVFKNNEFHGHGPSPAGVYPPGSVALDFSSSVAEIDMNDFAEWESALFPVKSPNYGDGGINIGLGNKFEFVEKEFRHQGGFFPGMHGQSSNCLINPGQKFLEGFGQTYSRHAVRTCDYRVDDDVLQLGAANAFRVKCPELKSSNGRFWPGQGNLHKWVGGEWILRFDEECTVRKEVFDWPADRTFAEGAILVVRQFSDGTATIIHEL